MSLIFRQLNPHACRTYLAGEEGSGEAVIIDPVLDHVDAYLELLEKEKIPLTQAIDTHSHADHISGAAVLGDHTGCEYVMHEAAPSQCITLRIDEDTDWNIGDTLIKIMHTPGHTKDSISLVLPDRILTGDVLFLDEGGAGRDDLPGGDPGEHWESLQRILELPDHLVVYPAHEYRNSRPSSLREQKARNPHLQHRSKGEYITYLEDLRLGPAEWMKDVLKANYACARDPKAAWIPTDINACEIKGTLEHGVNDLQVPFTTVDELKRKLDAGDKPTLLDVREEAELEVELGHLPGITHIPIGSLSDRLSELDSEEEVITVCRSGGRALTAGQILKQAGFQRVFVMEGGMTAWRLRGYPIAGGN